MLAKQSLLFNKQSRLVKQPKAVGIPSFQDAGWTKTRGTVGAMKPGPVKASGSGETTQGWGGWVAKNAVNCHLPLTDRVLI